MLFFKRLVQNIKGFLMDVIDLKMFPKVISTDVKGLELRFVEPDLENARLLFNMTERNRHHLLPFVQWANDDVVKDVNDSLAFLYAAKSDWEDCKNFEFGIFFDGAMCGWIDVHKINTQDRLCGLGYWLDKDMTGKGIIKYAISALEKELFNDFKMNRIFIRCDRENEQSKKVASRCGYVFEGELREDVFVRKENRFRTSALFSKLAKEFK